MTEGLYFHTAGCNTRPAHCIECTEPMLYIYDTGVRDVCSECGGRSKVADYSAPAPMRSGYVSDWDNWSKAPEGTQ